MRIGYDPPTSCHPVNCLPTVYVAAVCAATLLLQPYLLRPDGNGWLKAHGTWRVKWFEIDQGSCEPMLGPEHVRDDQSSGRRLKVRGCYTGRPGPCGYISGPKRGRDDHYSELEDEGM